MLGPFDPRRARVRVIFWSSGKPREDAIAAALGQAVRSGGDDFEVRTVEDYHEPSGDVGCVFGVKGIARRLLDDYRAAGRHALFFDKGHTRRLPDGAALWRVSADGFMPLDTFQRVPRPGDRAKAHGLSLSPRQFGECVLFAGASQKHCDFHGLGDCSEYARRVIAEVRAHTDRPVIYRPKPSWRSAVPIDGTEFSRSPTRLADELARCFVLVTHSSNAAVEAILAGVPAIVLGPGIARPVTSRTVADVEDPYWTLDEERRQWLADLAYCQWSVEEIASGETWKTIGRTIEYERLIRAQRTG